MQSLNALQFYYVSPNYVYRLSLFLPTSNISVQCKLSILRTKQCWQQNFYSIIKSSQKTDVHFAALRFVGGWRTYKADPGFHPNSSKVKTKTVKNESNIGREKAVAWYKRKNHISQSYPFVAPFVRHVRNHTILNHQHDEQSIALVVMI